MALVASRAVWATLAAAVPIAPAGATLRTPTCLLHLAAAVLTPLGTAAPTTHEAAAPILRNAAATVRDTDQTDTCKINVNISHMHSNP